MSDKRTFDLLGPEHLDLATMCRSEAGRYPLNGLLLEPGRVSASDGRVLVTVPTRRVDEADLVAGLVPEGAEPVSGKVSIDPVGLKKALAFAAKNANNPVLHYAVASFEAVDAVKEEGAKPEDPPVRKRVTLAATDLETSGVAKARVIEGECPDIDGVMPVQNKPVKVTLDAKVLKLVIAYVEKHGRVDRGMVETTLSIDADNPGVTGVLGTFPLADGEGEGRMLIMPIKPA